MATNNNGHLIDDSGNVCVDFVWGNFPMQPNDARTNRLDLTLDNHINAESGWGGFPLFTSNSTGSDVAGPTDYVKVPNVLGLTTSLASDAMSDAGLTPTTASAATNTPKTVTAVSRASGGLAVLTASGAGAAYAIGTKVTIASVHATVNGTYTVVDKATNSFTVATTDTSALSLTGLSGTVVGVAGTIKTQSIAADAATTSVGAAVTITPWA